MPAQGRGTPRTLGSRHHANNNAESVGELITPLQGVPSFVRLPTQGARSTATLGYNLPPPSRATTNHFSDLWQFADDQPPCAFLLRLASKSCIAASTDDEKHRAVLRWQIPGAPS